MRTSFAVLGFIAAALPAAAFGQADGTSPPPVYAPPPGSETAPPPPAYQPPPSGAVVVVSDSNAPLSMKGVSVWGVLPWGGLGVGARFMLPVPIPALLHSARVKDVWAVEFGADFLHFNYGVVGFSDYGVNYFLPVVGLMWQVWLTPQFAVYPKVEVGYQFAWVTGYPDGAGSRPGYGGPFLAGDAGLLYKLNNGITLRAEAGSANLKLGAGFLF